MTTIIDGKKISEKILQDLSQKISCLDKKPKLTVILVGDDPASQLYVGLKEKAAKKIGIESLVIKYPSTVSEDELINKIIELNNDSETTAILVQIPLPEHISERKILQTISPKKDVDGITPENIGKISIGVKPFAYPCTPKGIIRLLDEYGILLEGQHAVVIGRSNIVGKPISQMLLNRNATVTVCHSKTKNLEEIIKTADIVVSAVGKPKIIRKEMLKNNSVVIDVGTSKLDSKMVGDVDYKNVFEWVSFITPVPGGVGPMTIASLMENTFELFVNLS